MKQNNTQRFILHSPFSILHFIRKEFFHIFRDRWTMLILLAMPVVQIILFGFAISTEVKNINVAVMTPVRDEATRQITERIDASSYFTVTACLDSPDGIDRAFRSGTADFVIAFSPHFSDRLYSAEGSQIQWIPDATDTNTATTVVMYATDIVHSWLAEQLPATAVRGGIAPNLRMLYNPQMKSSYNFVPGVMGLILMLICAMMTSISIVREKETGTMEVLLVSPVKPIYIILSKMIPYLALSCINFTTILLLAVYLLDLPVEGSLFWITALSILFILVSLALGLLISTATRTQMAAMLLSAVVLMMPVIMLSGMIFPIESMPDILQAISHVIPARWYIAAIKKLMIEGLPVRYVVKEMAVLFVMAVFLIGVSMKKFKNRLE
ncbi:MAG: ABC transporter permease [Tannerella sp.]|jgi:ABC-2 type transport system permease protein|nr:ABC transporter permease [Tannerella sp.]